MSDDQSTPARPSFSSGSLPGRQDAAEPHPATSALPAQPPAPAPPAGQRPEEKTNTLAIVSLVSAFLVSLVAVITGHIALKQIKERGGRGRGLALWGTVLGYIGLAAQVVSVVLVMTLGLAAFGLAGQDGSALTPKQQEVSEQQDASRGQSSPSAGATDAPADGEDGGEAAQPDGGIQGHTVSAAFCKTYDAAVAANEAFMADSEGLAPGQALPAELLASYESLASVESPNQAAYQAFYEFAKDPTSITDQDQLGSVLNGFAKAAASDEVACAAL